MVTGKREADFMKTTENFENACE